MAERLNVGTQKKRRPSIFSDRPATASNTSMGKSTLKRNFNDVFGSLLNSLLRSQFVGEIEQIISVCLRGLSVLGTLVSTTTRLQRYYIICNNTFDF